MKFYKSAVEILTPEIPANGRLAWKWNAGVKASDKFATFLYITTHIVYRPPL
jgi:hypothetical protein